MVLVSFCKHLIWLRHRLSNQCCKWSSNNVLTTGRTITLYYLVYPIQEDTDYIHAVDFNILETPKKGLGKQRQFYSLNLPAHPANVDDTVKLSLPINPSWWYPVSHPQNTTSSTTSKHRALTSPLQFAVTSHPVTPPETSQTHELWSTSLSGPYLEPSLYWYIGCNFGSWSNKL